MATRKRAPARRVGGRKASGTKAAAKGPRGLVRYNFHNSQHTGTVVGVAKKGSTPKSTVLTIRPSQHFAGESATIHRRANVVRKASKPIMGHSHVRAFKHS